MLLPAIAARMKEWFDFAAFGVYRAEIAAFMPIALGTCQAEIFFRCGTAMLFSVNMVDFVCEV